MRLLLFISLFFSASHAGDWKQVYEDGEIVVSHDVSKSLPTYKGEGLVNANLFDLLAVLSDVKRRPEWVKNLDETRVVEGTLDTKVVIYEKFHLPWPCRDRDSVVESVIRPDFKNLEVTVDYHEVKNAAAPTRDGIVRMPTVRGNMFFQYIDEKHTFARLVMGLDVGGIIPGFIVDKVVRQAPTDTLAGLILQVKRTKGEYQYFIETNEAKAKKVSKVLFIPHVR